MTRAKLQNSNDFGVLISHNRAIQRFGVNHTDSLEAFAGIDYSPGILTVANCMTTQPTPPSGPTPAATLVVFRRAPNGGPPELLMLERSQAMRFVPGAAVFPGGRVDPSDHELAALMTGGSLAADEAAARIAAIRETLEEAGLVTGVSQAVTGEEAAAARAKLLEIGRLGPVLEQFGWRPELDRLVPLARWCPDFARAFDTRFYLTDLGTGAVELAADTTENTRLFWITAAAALEAARRDEMRVIFPTLRNLERIAQHDDFAAAAADAAAHPITIIRPWEEHRDGVLYRVIPEGLGYPVTSGPAVMPGGEK